MPDTSELTTYLPWAVAAVLLIVLIVLVVLLRRRATAAQEALRTREDAHRKALDEATAERERAARDAAEAHAREIEQVEARRVDAETSAQQSRALVAAGAKWEETSRRMVLDAVTDLGLDGVLVTNLVFVPVDATRTRQFVAQVDHVLLLPTVALVIENKGWKGVVLDGVHPRDAGSSFATLLGDLELEPPFAVQVKRDSLTSLELRTHDQGHAPRKQVRRQAQRISDLVRAETHRKPWFDTAVLYSHPDADVHADPLADDEGVSTVVIASQAQLRAHLEELVRRRRPGPDSPRLDELSALFSGLGADVTPFGQPVERAAAAGTGGPEAAAREPDDAHSSPTQA
ncbi:NERD domain-containing protein [Frigoribacterium sp. ACAM 257]|uniref:nuclease-related domain-containing protein n=1 Tax=Frigoribacterium sp. ACAM 257 TaxID=2508998 RepID=UPI0011B967BC|nr:nuclease-related domain-containing protein [Frigoribacterium sp. ACAM 257]TWX40608.1 NERD domain-containing protein [Frigoribacterium sp. ACAM 257]